MTLGELCDHLGAKLEGPDRDLEVRVEAGKEPMTPYEVRFEYHEERVVIELETA